MPVRKKDAQRALLLLEEYRAKLNHTEDRQLRLSIQRVIDIFQSNLFRALIDIQEFYEVTLLDSQKWVESLKEADPMAPINLWDFSNLHSPVPTSDTLPSLNTSLEAQRGDGELPEGRKRGFEVGRRKRCGHIYRQSSGRQSC